MTCCGGDGGVVVVDIIIKHTDRHNNTTVPLQHRYGTTVASLGIHVGVGGGYFQNLFATVGSGSEADAEFSWSTQLAQACQFDTVMLLCVDARNCQNKVLRRFLPSVKTDVDEGTKLLHINK